MIRHVCIVTGLVLGLAGCAHGKMGEVESELPKDTISKTIPILIEPITADDASVSGDKSGKADVVAKEKAKIASEFNKKIAEALVKKGYIAKVVPAGAKSGIVLNGEVTKIEHGSAAARYFGGMGAGSSNMYTNIVIQDRGQKKTLSRFQIIATSGGESGFGSYLDEHLAHGAKQIAEYIDKTQK